MLYRVTVTWDNMVEDLNKTFTNKEDALECYNLQRWIHRNKLHYKIDFEEIS